jgi:hypothetical protein
MKEDEMNMRFNSGGEEGTRIEEFSPDNWRENVLCGDLDIDGRIMLR